MFDKLIDWLVSLVNEIKPFFIIKEYEEAVRLRGGKYSKSFKKGFYLKIPFYDEIIAQHVVITTLDLPSQSLVTKDGKNIVIKAIVKYKIYDVKIFLLEVYDAKDALSDVAQGIIKDIMISSSWEDCINIEIDTLITRKVKNEVKKFGVLIEKVTLTNIGIIRSIRLFNENEIIKNE